MAEIHGKGPISPQEKKMYEQEYKKGVDLFQHALQQSSEAKNPYQKKQFQDVMNKAMNVLNETAKELKRKDLMAQNKQIASDYKAYQKDSSDIVANKLNEDLDKAKESIE